MITVLLAFHACETRTKYDFFAGLKGCVVDAGSGESLANASVTLMPGNRTLQTGADGLFFFDELDPGQYVLSVQKKSYYVERKTVTLVSGEVVQVDVFLEKI